MSLLTYLKDFNDLKDFEFVADFEYTGRGVSLNQFYNQGHWYTRKKLVQEYHGIFNKLLLTSGMERLDNYIIVVIYNSKHDPDNVVGMEKLFVDALKDDEKTDELRYIKDDNKNIAKGVMIFPDETLPKNTFKFLLFTKYNNGSN